MSQNGEARNLSQQQQEERQTVMAIIRQIEAMEYKEQAAKAGAWSTGLEGRVGHGSGKVGEKRRFRDVFDTGWVEAAEEGPRGEGGEKLKQRQEAERDQTQAGRVSRQGEREGCGEEKAFFVRGSGHGREGTARKGSWRGGGRRRRCEEGGLKVPAQPQEKPLQGMRRGEHLRAQPPKAQVQAVRRGEHLRAQPQKKRVQAMRRIRHL